MDKNTILKRIRTNNNLLSLPQVLSEVIIETSKEDYSADKLGDIILKDPSLTGRILRMSNSSFYNRLSEIKTVHQAISVMGMTTVKCLALSTSIFHPEQIEKDTGVDAKKFFTYILSIATASKKIAIAINLKSPEEAFIAGILHDIGHLFLMHYYPAQFVEILDRSKSGKSLIAVEKEILGIDHTEISEEIAKTWKLPNEILEAMSGHHDKEEYSNNTIKNIVKLANLLVVDNFSGYEVPINERIEGVCFFSELLKIKKKDVDEIKVSLLQDTLEFAQYLEVDIMSHEEMLTTANQEIMKSYLCVEKLFKERQELSKNLLTEERNRGAIESKNIAMATLSHYLNNAVMAIFGRTQIVKMQLEKGQHDIVAEKMPEMIKKIDESVHKIVAVIEEMKEVSPIDQKKFDSMSKAMNIDDRIEERLAKMKEDAQLHEPVA